MNNYGADEVKHEYILPFLPFSIENKLKRVRKRSHSLLFMF